MKLFEDYQKYVIARVKQEPHGYTLLRAGLEAVEESLEFKYSSGENAVEELGDLMFWFAYFSRMTGFKHDKIGVTSLPYEDLGQIMLRLVGNVKRFYRDHDAAKLVNIREEVLPHWFFYLVTVAKLELKIDLDELMVSNVKKLDGRFGSTISESEPFIKYGE